MNARDKYICVFCGSSEKAAEKYRNEIEALAAAMAPQYGLVFGGANVGLMKLMADAVIKRGGKVKGVVTPRINKMRVNYEGIEIIEMPDLAARKQKMMELSDACITLPGGFGTLDEESDLSVHNQFASNNVDPQERILPNCVFNIDGFYTHYLEQLKRCKEEGFITEKHFNMVYFSDDPEKIISYIVNFNPELDDSRWWERQSEPSVVDISVFPRVRAQEDRDIPISTYKPEF